MRNTVILTLLMGFALASFGQEAKVNLKKEKLYINENAVCRIEKKKNGFLSIASFEVKTLDEKPLGLWQYQSVHTPMSGILSWYKLTFEGIDDSIQFISKDLMAFSKSILSGNDDALGKIIANYNLIKDNAIDKEAIAQLKKDFSTDHSKTYVAQLEKENFCKTQLTGPGQSDAALPAEVIFVSNTEVSKNTTVLAYDIMQNGKKIGTIIAKGSPKGAKQEDAEYDYSSGILDLDGATPLEYEFNNQEGCTLARYFSEEKLLKTWKDGVTIKSGDVKKHNKDGVKSRIAFMQAMVNYLVAKRYL